MLVSRSSIGSSAFSTTLTGVKAIAGKKRHGKSIAPSAKSINVISMPAGPASTTTLAPDSDSQRALALVERCQLLAQTDAIAKELERRTMTAFFDHLAGRPVDPRITQRFSQQSSGWRVPWSASEPSSEMPIQVDPSPATVPLDGARGYVRLGRARSLRG